MADKIRWQKLRKHGKQLGPMSKHTFETVTSQEVTRERKERNPMYMRIEATNEDAMEPAASNVFKIRSRNAKKK
uniref:Uncharacterized protein n=1 Tax=viral metagenome TaxID=1070528 RepID=A0A6C0CHR4_9ZZZZ